MIGRILQQARSETFRDDLRELLLDICRIDTTPNADVGVMRTREAAVFTRLEHELDAIALPGSASERRAVNPAIAAHPAYSQLHFTKTAERPAGLTPEETYAGRSNLLYLVRGAAGGLGAAVNAHIDVVAPYLPPVVDGTTVSGRGALDDKGAVVAMIGAFKLLAQALGGRPLSGNIVAMMVIEEETGGNGSLSLALDRELRQLYDSIMVLECCDNRIHPANRGAVWYKTELQLPGGSAFEMAAFVIEEMEKEGRAIKAESRHALFPQRPVQTCHGIMGHIGEHPSRICAELSFDIDFGKAPEPATELVGDCLEFALAEYIGRYGDKTREDDPRTGRKKVDHHYDVTPGATGLTVAVHGKSGHMGAIDENDGAITKLACMVRALVYSRPRLEQLAGAPMTLRLNGWEADARLPLEGGQGFVPNHDITEVMDRVARAAERGAENYLRRIGRPERGSEAARTTYDKLHNNAFDGDPRSAAMRHAIAAAKACGTWPDEPIRGWTVSCDARLFADEYPDMPVITSGPGSLEYAHSDDEKVDLNEVAECAAFVALWLLYQTETPIN